MDDARPVLVAGAGPVGLAAALLLARSGVPSVVLEAAPRRDPVGSKAICMQRDALDVLDRIGCAAPLVEEGVTWWRGRTFYRQHELFQITFPEQPHAAFPPFVNVPQSSTERVLERRAREEPAVTLAEGHEVVALRQHEDGVTVETATTDGSARWEGTHLLAADGARSRVRHLLGLGFEGRSFDDQFLIADIRAELPFAEERRFFFDPPWNPGRQVLVHPQPDSVWRIDWQVPADFDLAAERASGALDDRIRQITGERPYEVVWVSAYRFHQRVASSFRVGRVLLAGDAAHLMAPFGARGLNSGIHDAENAAWKLAFVREGWAGEELLATYDGERRAAALENLRITGATMRFLVPRTEEDRAWRLHVLDRAVTDPDARRQVDSGKLAEPFWYLESPLTTAAGDPGSFPTAPGVARPPVAGVLCPDGPCRAAEAGVTRLRQLVGPGFLVLAGAGVDAGALAQACARATPAPVRTVALAGLDPEGGLARALDARPGRAWLVRPDGHLAAVVDAHSPAALVAALHRACAHPAEQATA